MVEHAEFDREAVVDELEQARLVFHGLLQASNRSDLRRASAGTRWTNEQLLFHLLFGYIIVLALLLLVRLFSWLQCRVLVATARELSRGMHYPTRWDPFFREYMTLGELFHYPTQHFDFHRHQLTLGPAAR